MPKKKELIQIDFEKQTCNAEDLHSWLKVQTRFNDWINKRIQEYDFLEGKDYFIFTQISVKKGRPKRDYMITVDMAKELSMVERTPQGRKSRQYFIKVEKQYKRFLKMRTAPERIPHRRENLMHNKAFNEAVEKYVKYVEGKSSLPSRYYMLFNNMVNHALFEFPKKLKDIPDKLSIAQLNFSNTAKQVVANEIEKRLKVGEDYETIKKACKERVLKVADAIGVTPIPELLEQEETILIQNKG